MDEEVAAVMADHAKQVALETVEPEQPSIDSLPQPLAVLRRSTGDIENNTECVFYILGTAHVSRKSCDDAATLINLVKPELVLVELCNERQAILTLEKRTEVGVIYLRESYMHRTTGYSYLPKNLKPPPHCSQPLSPNKYF